MYIGRKRHDEHTSFSREDGLLVEILSCSWLDDLLLDKCHEAIAMSGYQRVRGYLSPTCFPTHHHSNYLSLGLLQDSVKVTGVCNVASFRLVVLIPLLALARYQATSIRSRVQAVGPPNL